MARRWHEKSKPEFPATTRQSGSGDVIFWRIEHMVDEFVSARGLFADQEGYCRRPRGSSWPMTSSGGCETGAAGLLEFEDFTRPHRDDAAFNMDLEFLGRKDLGTTSPGRLCGAFAIPSRQLRATSGDAFYRAVVRAKVECVRFSQANRGRCGRQAVRYPIIATQHLQARYGSAGAGRWQSGHRQVDPWPAGSPNCGAW